MRPQLMYRYCPRCGAGVTVEESAAKLECPQCALTLYFNPTVAAAGVLHTAEGEIALLVRAREPHKGCFGLPGGFIDFGESAEAALEREVFEEIGLKIQSAQFLMSAPNHYHYKAVTYSVVDLFFSVQVEGFDAVVLQQGEVRDLWVGRPTDSELGRMAFPSNRLAVERFLARSGS